VVLPYYLCCVEKRVCLSRGVQVTGVAWWAVPRIEAGVGDFVQRTENDQAQVGYSVVRQLRGRVMLCVVYTMHRETRSVSFLVWPQKQGMRVSWIGTQNW
jgi:hypothetical protein